MRIVVCIVFLVVLITGLAASLTADMYANMLGHFFQGKPLPPFSELIITARGCYILLPVPWLISGVFLMRRTPSVRALLIYTCSAMLVAIATLWLFIIGAVGPFTFIGN